MYFWPCCSSGDRAPVQSWCPRDGAAPEVNTSIYKEAASTSVAAIRAQLSLPHPCPCVSHSSREDDKYPRNSIIHGEKQVEKEDICSVPDREESCQCLLRVYWSPGSRGGHACGNITSVISAGSRLRALRVQHVWEQHSTPGHPLPTALPPATPKHAMFPSFVSIP